MASILYRSTYNNGSKEVVWVKHLILLFLFKYICLVYLDTCCLTVSELSVHSWISWILVIGLWDVGELSLHSWITWVFVVELWVSYQHTLGSLGYLLLDCETWVNYHYTLGSRGYLLLSCAWAISTFLDLLDTCCRTDLTWSDGSNCCWTIGELIQWSYSSCRSTQGGKICRISLLLCCKELKLKNIREIGTLVYCYI